jgi:hypothetical protein
LNITNAAPTITSASITPDPAGDLQDITCNPSGYSDVDNDPATYYYQWYKDTILQSEISETANVLDAGNTTTDDDWYCKVKGSDGTYNSSYVTSQTVTIGSSFKAPAITWVNATTISTGINSTSLIPTPDNSNVNLSLNFTDPNDENWTIYFCKSNQFNDLTCDDGLWCQSDNNQSEKLVSCIVSSSGLSGDYDYYGFVLDNNSYQSPGYAGSFSVNTPPYLTQQNITSPYYTNIENVSILFSSTDNESDSINHNLWVYNGSTYNFTSELVESEVYNFTEQSEGNVSYYVVPEDQHEYNGSNSSIWTLVFDYTLPGLSLTEPTGEKSSRSITTYWSASDTYINTCTYNVSLKSSPSILYKENTNVDCGDGMDGFTLGVDGEFTLNFCALDLANNIEGEDFKLTL